MKLGLGHGPRFHLNLFSPRCRWPCITQTASSIGSNSTNSSLLDNDHTSSWTYIQYLQAQPDADPGSTLNDIELISLINQGSLVDESEHDESGASGGEPVLLSPSERHARRDVRTLFPENSEDGPTDEGDLQHRIPSDPQYVNLAAENLYVNLAAGSSGQCTNHQRVEAQYVNLPLPRECVPVYTASNGSNRSSSSHGRQSLSSASFDDNEDLFPGGDHPYGIPSSLLGGVLLNLDNQFRLSANSEWENWSEFLTDSDRETTNRQNNNAATSSGEQGRINRTSGSSSSFGAASEATFDEEHAHNNDTLESEQFEDANQNRVPHNTPNLIGGFALPLGHIALPAPPSSNSSTRSSRSSGGPQQQEWYFYDPRLIPESRTERVTLDTSFRGLHNRCHMSSIIQPPPYEELLNEDPGASANGEAINVVSDGSIGYVVDGDTMDYDPPPPYTDCEPPPSYDQTFGHTLAFPTFNLGLPINPLERRLAASLCSNRPPMTSNTTPDPDLLTDVNIDELLQGTPTSTSDTEADDDTADNNELFSRDNEAPYLDNPAVGENAYDADNDDENVDEEDLNNNLSPRRYPVGFCLGRRPPLRWSRGMSPNRWTSTESWAHQ